VEEVLERVIMDWILAVTVCAGVSFGLGFPTWRLLVSRNILDKPNDRSSHARPTARGGGVAILGAIGLGALALGSFPPEPVLLLAVAVAWALGAVSFADDMRGVSAGVRFGCHAVAAAGMLAALAWSDGLFANLGEGVPMAARVVLGSALFLWICGHTNAFNFMDGINGIAGFQGFLTAAGMIVLSGLHTGEWFSPPQRLCALIAGGCLGFLPHNFPKARMFMGDVGSAPLGFLLAFALVWLCRRHGWELLAPLALIHANFVLDTGITLGRRVLRGEKWHLPHREHFYQRLIRAGRTHAFVSSSEALLVAACVGILALSLAGGILVKTLAYFGVLAVWGIFFLRIERVFVASGK